MAVALPLAKGLPALFKVCLDAAKIGLEAWWPELAEQVLANHRLAIARDSVTVTNP